MTRTIEPGEMRELGRQIQKAFGLPRLPESEDLVRLIDSARSERDEKREPLTEEDWGGLVERELGAPRRPKQALDTTYLEHLLDQLRP